MPTWSPNWTDVRFDQAAAERAADQCERAARVVRDTTRRREVLATSALASGRGPWRAQLARQRAGLNGQADEIEARLRALAVALRQAGAHAQVDQHGRESARERWTTEARAEAAAADEAPTPGHPSPP